MKQRKRTVAAIPCFVSGSVFGAGFQLYTEGATEALGQLYIPGKRNA